MARFILFQTQTWCYLVLEEPLLSNNSQALVQAAKPLEKSVINQYTGGVKGA